MQEQLSSSKEIWGQPRGLAYIVFTEAWERFSFYGMQALMVLYMTDYLFTPEIVGQVAGFEQMRSVMQMLFGELSTQALIAQLFGAYIGLVYFMPVLGGLLGDRVLGRRNAVLWGALSMAVGHFLMAFESSFLAAMLALIVGSGLLKGNLAAQVGALYASDDKRRDTAYSYYSIAINVGAFLAPLACGTLGELYGWHYGFSLAGLGMLVGIAIYLSGAKHLPVDPERKKNGQALNSAQWRTVWALLFVLILSSLYWIGQTQVWNVYPLWVKARIDRELLDFTIPVTWFQSIDTLAVLLVAPALLAFWNKQRQNDREPLDILKIAMGCGLFALACLVLALAEWQSAGASVAVIWPLLFHFLCAFAYLYSAPIALSLASRHAPESVNSMVVGAFYLAIFLGSLISGKLGAYYQTLSHAQFWLMHAGIAFVGAVIFFAVRNYRWPEESSGA
ncbi:peptide MFS transporter [Pseudoteredinibacter isoporae]|uniref:POT family proton-dependent oligopeptide transporter n=1 Tax=Pseudoteredinibacter isoporae TaxID=570281 RepID=A0A7X0JVU5_9GAMM|nr:peptide MFS transporter [Pseudoteredinibacter isoporae]MBB6522216.1 POT family proton-dependent oligopeptide transporter [Pseudoteredinibacter isoporae]NHO87750.1 peptide MFS transporter [Pseudoteredinibacter isoporae]NIB23919.1 peptide MFS transporter [Pseudoteredinibacter isoporae]